MYKRQIEAEIPLAVSNAQIAYPAHTLGQRHKKVEWRELIDELDECIEAMRYHLRLERSERRSRAISVQEHDAAEMLHLRAPRFGWDDRFVGLPQHRFVHHSSASDLRTECFAVLCG